MVKKRAKTKKPEKSEQVSVNHTTLLENDPITLVERVYKLWWHWADFSVMIIHPTVTIISPPVVIMPDTIPNSNELEFVYPIHDHGYKLVTSKAQEMYSAGMSMCKLYYTIEKMIFLLLERLKESGVSTETQVQIAFGGHELPRRKGFESIINLPHGSYELLVTNFEPGIWGERYLKMVKHLADKNYGYPPETPRTNYRRSHGSTPSMAR